MNRQSSSGVCSAEYRRSIDRSKAKEYYEENKEELKLRHGIRSLTAFITYCIREYFKEKGII